MTSCRWFSSVNTKARAEFLHAGQGHIDSQRIDRDQQSDDGNELGATNGKWKHRSGP
jgi:hypothetical protein